MVADSKSVPDPVVKTSSGPVLVLCDGSVVKPRVAFDHWDKMIAIGYDQEAAVYGPEADDPRVSLSFDEDPDAGEVEAVEDVLEAYGFGGDD